MLLLETMVSSSATPANAHDFLRNYGSMFVNTKPDLFYKREFAVTATGSPARTMVGMIQVA